MLTGDREQNGQALRRTAAQIPRRPGRRVMLSDQLLLSLPAEDRADRRVELTQRKVSSSTLAEALCGVLAQLSADERKLLELRFADGWTVSRIAATSGHDPRLLYRWFARLLRRLRQQLEAGGWKWQEVQSCLGGGEIEVQAGLLATREGDPPDSSTQIELSA